MHGMPSSSHTSRQVPLPAIGSKTRPGRKYRQQVFDEIAAAIARIAPVAVLARTVKMIRGWSDAAPGWRWKALAEAWHTLVDMLAGLHLLGC